MSRWDAEPNPNALPVGTLLLDPGENGSRPRVWTVVSARTVISADPGVSMRATLRATGKPKGWRVINNAALASTLMPASENPA